MFVFASCLCFTLLFLITLISMVFDVGAHVHVQCLILNQSSLESSLSKAEYCIILVKKKQKGLRPKCFLFLISSFVRSENRQMVLLV